MHKQHTILALDDNELTLRTYQRCFEAAGHRVILSSTSRQAIDLAQQHHPGLALIDINLSNQDSKDGYGVCRELLSGHHSAAV
ncbi:MAG: response regulator, partial [Elusimicrobiota bacterium]